jgi:hypothetical protein
VGLRSNANFIPINDKISKSSTALVTISGSNLLMIAYDPEAQASGEREQHTERRPLARFAAVSFPYLRKFAVVVISPAMNPTTVVS